MSTEKIDPDTLLVKYAKLIEQEVEKNEERKSEIEKYREEQNKRSPVFISRKQYQFEGYFTAEQLVKLGKFLQSDEMKE